MDFKTAYKNLNTAQKKAVDTIEGPVMVVAGPGTGKTQVLALRIGYILENTDTPPSGILCLTFTRSGVTAMRNRLESYIGDRARDVKITTFHSFALELVEKYYSLLGFQTIPKLLDESDNVLLFDEILEDYEWQYIRPRTNPSFYFSDMTNLIGLLKRESITPENFLDILKKEILFLENDESSISTRGERKGQLKKEVLDTIESLKKTTEVIRFYEIYEALKRERGLMDYNDVLSYSVNLVTTGEDVRSELQESFLYVLVDEHQDSTGIQNAFLKAVWKDVEKPNIFIVGDDRQLIYGFSGAELEYFTQFKNSFGKAEVISLVENYRSTQEILDLSHTLLESDISKELLISNRKAKTEVGLFEYNYPRDEILAAGLYFKSKIEGGVDPSECVLLVPKNYQVRSAIEVFRSIDLPVSSLQTTSLFTSNYFTYLRTIFNFVVDPTNPIILTNIILNPFFGVPVLLAHSFVRSKKAETITLDDLLSESQGNTLFGEQNKIGILGQQLNTWLNSVSGQKISFIVSVLGNELLIDTAKNHKDLIERAEILRTVIHLALMWEEKHVQGTMSEFLQYIGRLENYGQMLPVASFGLGNGVSVMTLHRSKGLEFEHVWIGHMNEEVLMSEKRLGLTLPKDIKEKIHAKDAESVSRELYVALTRAKSHVVFSYSTKNYTGQDLTLSRLLYNLPTLLKSKVSKEETEKALLLHGPEFFVKKPNNIVESSHIKEVTTLTKDNFEKIKISVSMLNNFFECPWKWYFRNFLRLPELKSVSLALGSSVHSTLEYILKADTLPGTKDIEEKIKIELIKEGVGNSKELARLFNEAKLIVEDWKKSYYSTLSQNRISERSLFPRSPDFPTLSMYGKIDLTEILPNDDIIVTDFKTGSEKTKNVIEKLDEEGRLSSYMRQLAMYAYLFKHSEKKDLAQIRLLFLEAPQDSKNKLYSTHITQETLDMLVKDIADYKKSLEDGTWVNRSCYHKSFGKSGGECEYCVRSRNIFAK